uniref:Aspartate/glutamate/uridylate kinase domain-containing protein n=1 Tax=Palpitomonas bilix TaxID=652834 RepID=A0A7S3DDL2_9EUKA|mmetsp:Transcript_32639/g.84283  ORF Transcript_32639/g.84283 Transcript_32639/m.84283 type:complete len:307 (+) Transcript_32639:80-1000(+)
MSRVAIVKFGGAAVTNKTKKWCLEKDLLRNCCKSLAGALSSGYLANAVIVHGAGSFGHFEAKEYAIGKTVPSNKSELLHLLGGVRETRKAVKALNDAVVEGCIEHEIAAARSDVVVSPSVPLHSQYEEAVKMTQAGLVPVMHGEVVSTFAENRYKILSGDIIIEELCEVLAPAFPTAVHECFFISNVPGIFTKPPEEEGAELIKEVVVSKFENDGAKMKGMSDEEIKKRIRSIELWNGTKMEGAEQLSLGGSGGTDVTGGILSKFGSAINIAAMGIPVLISDSKHPVLTTIAADAPAYSYTKFSVL